jgi:methionine-gamma-lyase
VISYIEHPASMTHSGIPAEDRLTRGITDSLVRLSVGVEGFSTLSKALDVALNL